MCHICVRPVVHQLSSHPSLLSLCPCASFSLSHSLHTPSFIPHPPFSSDFSHSFLPPAWFLASSRVWRVCWGLAVVQRSAGGSGGGRRELTHWCAQQGSSSQHHSSTWRLCLRKPAPLPPTWVWAILKLWDFFSLPLIHTNTHTLPVSFSPLHIPTCLHTVLPISDPYTHAHA